HRRLLPLHLRVQHRRGGRGVRDGEGPALSAPRLGCERRRALLLRDLAALPVARGVGRCNAARYIVAHAPGGDEPGWGGRGHGVGLCQWGAVGRARAGEDYGKILATYFPGTKLERLY